MKNEKLYEVKVTQVTCGYYYMHGGNEEEAVKNMRNEMERPEWTGPEEFVSEKVEVVGYKMINGTDLEQFYLGETDTTIIWEYTYEDGELIKEQIIGYYHGEPNSENLERYAYKGVIGRMG